MTSAVEIIINAKDNTGAAFGSVTSGLAKFAGVAVAAAATAVTAGFVVMAKEALDVTASYERLTLTMESLSAREIKNADATLSMADALILAKEPAQELLKWSQELAIHSPFDQETIAESLKQAMAYGFTSEEAKKLTQNLTDLGAGMGFGAEKMNLVSYALGQINQSGNLMTQDLRQLMSAGVPVVDILNDMGYSLEDVGKKSISSKEFLDKFNEMVETDFAGAADRGTHSWAGLLSTLGDVKKIGLRTLFKDTFTALQPLVDGLTTWLMGDGLVKLQEWGAAMGNFATNTIDFLSNSNNFDLSNLTGQFKDFMRGMDWKKFSTDVVNGINSIDWVAVGQEVRTSAANIWKGLQAAAEGIDWQAVTSALGNGIGGVIAGLSGYVSWDAFALDLSNKLAGAFGYAGEGAIFALADDFSAGFNFITGIISTSIAGWKLLIQDLTNVFLTVLTGLLGITSAIFSAIALSIASKLNGVKSAIQSILGGIGSIFGEAAGEWMSEMASGVLNGISNVISAIMKMVSGINNALANVQLPNLFSGGGSNSGGGGRPASNLGGAAAGGGTSRPRGNNVQAQALGGEVYAGGSYIVGEVGRELFVPKTDGRIIPKGAGMGSNTTRNNYYNARITIYSGKQNQARTVRGLT